jgi:tetratricopeptide (TPR) repeat protein
VTDGNYVIHNNLGFELALQGQKDKALKHYEEALRINPNFELATSIWDPCCFPSGSVKRVLLIIKRC